MACELRRTLSCREALPRGCGAGVRGVLKGSERSPRREPSCHLLLLFSRSVASGSAAPWMAALQVFLPFTIFRACANEQPRVSDTIQPSCPPSPPQALLIPPDVSPTTSQDRAQQLVPAEWQDWVCGPPPLGGRGCLGPAPYL